MENANYNGWSNKETWLVNLWWCDALPEFFAEDQDREDVSAAEMEEQVRAMVEECEALSQLPAGLLSDFIELCWAEVNWNELAEAMTRDMLELMEN